MRFIYKDDITDATQALALDDALCQMREQGKVSDTIFLWKPPKFIYIPIGSSVNYIDYDYAEQMGYPVKRSNTLVGKPESSIIVGHCWNVICAIGVDENTIVREHFYKYGYGVWIYVANKLGLNLEVSGNDCVVEGTDRKIVGFGFSTTDLTGKQSLCTNTYISEETPPIDMNRFFKLPAEKFEGKTVNSASERVSSVVAETGKPMDKESIIKYVKEYFTNLGIELEDGDFTTDELDLANQLYAKHESLDWIKYAEFDK